ncbi:hypothetical protein H0194_10590 [Corynebacterium incognita]|uniref:Uncharacterized protein n=1 Tax=Corynebacterium incognita TaxID=2754725 RepID=A0A7G7CPD9_9CORY|nr:hypothetical protein [Corynebacterium incognita]QNE89455.1 hypothetical protein H0194_10590 [Corynebacterium incognita]
MSPMNLMNKPALLCVTVVTVAGLGLSGCSAVQEAIGGGEKEDSASSGDGNTGKAVGEGAQAGEGAEGEGAEGGEKKDGGMFDGLFSNATEHTVEFEGGEAIVKAPEDWTAKSEEMLEEMGMSGVNILSPEAQELPELEAGAGGAITVMVAKRDGQFVQDAKTMAEFSAADAEGNNAQAGIKTEYKGETTLDGKTAHEVTTSGKAGDKDIEGFGYMMDLGETHVLTVSATGEKGSDNVKKAKKFVEKTKINIK